jgi:hypothetical protein
LDQILPRDPCIGVVVVVVVSLTDDDDGKIGCAMI